MSRNIKQVTTEIFIERAKNVHGETYDYSLSHCIGLQKKITIVCPRHGRWEAEANSHLKGSKCPDCSRNKLTHSELVEQANDVHKGKYGYSKSVFITWKRKIKITCPIHGDFEQSPMAHIKQKAGCRKCTADSKSMGLKEFIFRAQKVHGTRYKYSEVNYKNSSSKVKIICPTHGVFEQAPASHIHAKQGCPSCGGTKVLTTEAFVERAKKMHGQRYDYSKVQYVNGKTKVKIICRDHGIFEQQPSHHMNGFGCPWCSGQGRYSTERWIEAAKLVHGEKYDYSRVEYKNSKSFVSIICKQHGSFKQLAGSHMQGKGCLECSGNRKKTTEEFIAEAKAVHGERYDYSITEYTNRHTFVKVICKEHGEFQVLAGHHLMGVNCFQCSGTPKLNTLQFVTKAIETHENTYDYTDTVYIDADTKIAIRCPKHGIWKQAPFSHLAGHGCPGCKAEDAPGSYTITGADRGDFDGKKFKVYLVRLSDEAESFYKIGLTVQTIVQRNPADNKYAVRILDILEDIEPSQAVDFEQSYLMNKIVAQSAYEPKKKFGGWTECFKTLPEGFTLENSFEDYMDITDKRK